MRASRRETGKPTPQRHRTTTRAFAAELALAADSFIVTRTIERQGEKSEVPTVIAGYHWFTDWGRDTMISLPGLTLPLGKAKTRLADKILRSFALFSREGLLPNNFPDTGSTPQYNTVDATLWMFQAVDALANGTGNMNTARNLYPLLADMIAWHVKGTRHGIHVDSADGLLAAGEQGVQLTWMDAKVDNWVVTPRIGKPVEINALWYNALKIMDKLRRSLGRTVVAGREEPPDFQALAQQVNELFRKRFWYDAGDYLFDVIDGPDGPDTSLRPNQLLALSLNSDLLSVDQSRLVLAAVRKHLLTPYGLRTLSPEDPRYIGIYTGTRVRAGRRVPHGHRMGVAPRPLLRRGARRRGRRCRPRRTTIIPAHPPGTPLRCRTGQHQRNIRRRRPPHPKRLYLSSMERCRNPSASLTCPKSKVQSPKSKDGSR